MFLKNLVYPKTLYLNSFLLLTSTSLINLYHRTTKKPLQKSLYTKHKKLSSLTRGCSLPIFTANETITKLMQYKVSQEKTNLLKASLYFPIQTDKIRKSEIFTTFEKIHRSFINNLKSEETKSQIKVHISYFANYYFYNQKPSPCILRQHCILRNLKKNKDIIITKPDKGNGVIQKIISNSCKFEKLDEDPTFLRKLKEKYFFNEDEYNKLYPSGFAPAPIYGTPKMQKFSSSDSFPKLRPVVSSISTFNYNLAGYLCDLPSP